MLDRPASPVPPASIIDEMNDNAGAKSRAAEPQELDVSIPDMSTADIASDALASSIPWIVTPTTTVQKSVFIGRAVKVESVEQAKGYINALLASDKKVAKATHNITGLPSL